MDLNHHIFNQHGATRTHLLANIMMRVSKVQLIVVYNLGNCHLETEGQFELETDERHLLRCASSLIPTMYLQTSHDVFISVLIVHRNSRRTVKGYGGGAGAESSPSSFFLSTELDSVGSVRLCV